jgi:RNA polymerase sigma factor (sigma-70 family)
VRQPDDAADVLQSTMLAALAGLQGEQRTLRLRPWLYRIAHNEAVSLLRRQPALLELDEAAILEGRDVVASASTRERLRELLRDLASLTERQRGALLMRELSGLGYAEIADALGTSTVAAKRSVHDARIALHDARDGHELACASVRSILSERDGRAIRGRRLRAHLRECEGCRDYRGSIGARRRDLLALVPAIPAGTATATLEGIVGGGAAAVGGGGALGALGGQAIGAAATKAATAAVLAATVGAGAAAYVEIARDGTRVDRAETRSVQETDDVARAVESPPHPQDPRRAEIRARLAYADGDRSRASHVRGRGHRSRGRDEDRRAGHSDDRSGAEPVAAPSPDRDRHSGPAPAPGRVPGSERAPDSAGGAGGGHGSSDSGGGEGARSGSSRDLADMVARDVTALIDRYVGGGDPSAGSLRSGDIDRIVTRATSLVDDYADGMVADAMTDALVAEDISRLADRYAAGTIGGAGELRTQISRAISGLPRLGH